MGSRFYYSAYDAPKKSAYSSKNEFQKVYYHELGTPQSADKLVYEDKAHPLRYFSAVPSEDGKWLFIVGSEGTSGTEILYKKVSEPKFRTLLPGFDADYMPVDCKDDQLYYVTNENASNCALMKIDLNRPAQIATVIPEDEKNLLEGVGSAGGYLFASYLEDAQSRIRQYDYDGKYFFSASYRRDASSRFHPDHRWGNFGSVGGAWLLTKENFLKDVKWLNMLKLKAS